MYADLSILGDVLDVLSDITAEKKPGVLLIDNIHLYDSCLHASMGEVHFVVTSVSPAGGGSKQFIVPLCPLSLEETKYFLTKHGVKVNGLPKLESQSELESDSEFKQNDAKIFYLEEFMKSK